MRVSPVVLNLEREKANMIFLYMSLVIHWRLRGHFSFSHIYGLVNFCKEEPIFVDMFFKVVGFKIHVAIVVVTAVDFLCALQNPHALVEIGP
jgi:hypothetical protein